MIRDLLLIGQPDAFSTLAVSPLRQEVFLKSEKDFFWGNHGGKYTCPLPDSCVPPVQAE